VRLRIVIDLAGHAGERGLAPSVVIAFAILSLFSFMW